MVNKITIKIIIILIMLCFIFYLLLSSHNLSCTNCTVSFSTKKVFQTNSQRLDFNMSDLFELTKTKKCPVSWDRVMGYVKN